MLLILSLQDSGVNISDHNGYPPVKRLAREMLTFPPFHQNLRRALIITNNYNLRAAMTVQVPPSLIR